VSPPIVSWFERCARIGYRERAGRKALRCIAVFASLSLGPNRTGTGRKGRRYTWGPG